LKRASIKYNVVVNRWRERKFGPIMDLKSPAPEGRLEQISSKTEGLTRNIPKFKVLYGTVCCPYYWLSRIVRFRCDRE
jgi:hypothetical protein